MELVMEAGERTRRPESIPEIRARFANQWRELPEQLKTVHAPRDYRVEVCESLRELDNETARVKKLEEVDELFANRQALNR
jgi:hypothetical protein